MTTRPSPPQSTQSVIAFTEEIHWAEAPAGIAGGGDGERADGDPVRGLVQAAVGDRPLEEVVRLVTLLEESPQYADAAGHVLRAVALDRPVEEVARLVAALTRPPRAVDSADDTIRAAVAHRCVEDVTRLVDLLHRAPQQPHCGREAVRAAAAGRPVEELVELIGRLARRRDDLPNEAATEEPAATEKEAAAHPSAGLDDHSAALPAPDAGEASASAPPPPDPDRDRERSGRPVFWPSWLAAAALVVCGAAHFPLRREGASVLVYGVALAVSGLCGLLALVLALRAGVALLVAGAVVPAALAGIGYFEGRFASAELTRSLAITVAPPWSAGLTAVCASLASLAALSLLLMVQVAEKHPAPRPLE
ncbi:hypothetical protein RKE30_19225 [Streptomyces sp. Li-HN-5-11]|uniref:hypothetical protein n=1 Tax=Streptomyces sp. Li-HN-5-11 TaxID=3075432 RepID=UPI0028A7ECDD|nr:hypothetical protein [Streptomyces sp. Li-HN-5-11]WNM32391.1 hypothetical protein RKE30_19225 [Streptomyces sp. Li-HN-5-11]WOP38851.1 hypothetical protein RKE32_36385 [Streptomyces sp. Li-HN-5-13]